MRAMERTQDTAATHKQRTEQKLDIFFRFSRRIITRRAAVGLLRLFTYFSFDVAVRNFFIGITNR